MRRVEILDLKAILLISRIGKKRGPHKPWAVRQHRQRSLIFSFARLFPCDRRKSMKRVLIFVALSLGMVSAGTAFSAQNDGSGNLSGLQNFHVVLDHQIWRSGRPPSLAVIQTLASQGLRTILDVENDNAAIAQERQWAQQAGVNFISAEMDSFQPVNENEINQDLNILNDPRNGVVLVHCFAGSDRTGLVIGLYRVLYQHWAPQDAYKEMLSYGFHSNWWDLD